MQRNLKKNLFPVSIVIIIIVGLLCALLSYRFSGDIFKTSQFLVNQGFPQLTLVSKLKYNVAVQQILSYEFYLNEDHDRFLEQNRKSRQICLNILETIESEFNKTAEINRIRKHYDFMDSLSSKLGNTLVGKNPDRDGAKILLSEIDTVSQKIIQQLDSLISLISAKVEQKKSQNKANMIQIQTTVILLNVSLLLILLLFCYYAAEFTRRQKIDEDPVDSRYLDSLTNLPNRQSLQQQLIQILTSTNIQASCAVLCLLEIDRFKQVSRNLGHDIGDELLQEVASRIKSSLQKSSYNGDQVSLYRFKGDMFALLLVDFSTNETLKLFAKTIVDDMHKPFYVDTRQHFLTLSCGITILSSTNQDSVVLLRNAGAALHQAEQLGGDRFCLYSPEMNNNELDQLPLENYLRYALEHDELCLYYQPQIDVKTEKVVGMEALLRWHHPDQGLLTPDKFIHIAEDSGIVVQISEWILRTACRQNKLWQDQGLGKLTVAINISTRQFLQPNLSKLVASVLNDTGLEPQYLELEITESIAVQDLINTQSLLTELKHLGIRISIDDFGTGYSSLSYIKHFPVNKIKVDQSFIREIVSDPYDAGITRAIITLGHSLSLTVVAEGIENRQQFHWLKQEGCDQVQGYIFSKPIATDEFEKFLKSNKNK